MSEVSYEDIGASWHSYPPSQVTLYGCRRCGVAVWDREAHDGHHGWPDSPEVDCPDCLGSGDIAQAVDMSDAAGCPTCESTGRVPKAFLSDRSGS